MDHPSHQDVLRVSLNQMHAYLLRGIIVESIMSIIHVLVSHSHFWYCADVFAFALHIPAWP